MCLCVCVWCTCLWVYACSCMSVLGCVEARGWYLIFFSTVPQYLLSQALTELEFPELCWPVSSWELPVSASQPWCYRCYKLLARCPQTMYLMKKMKQSKQQQDPSLCLCHTMVLHITSFYSLNCFFSVVHSSTYESVPYSLIFDEVREPLADECSPTYSYMFVPFSVWVF